MDKSSFLICDDMGLPAVVRLLADDKPYQGICGPHEFPNVNTKMSHLVDKENRYPEVCCEVP